MTALIGAAVTTPAAVTAAALVTALATGLGALPLAVAHLDRGSWIRGANVVAGALMLVASGMLLYQGAATSARGTLAGAAAGVVAIELASRWLRARERWRFGSLRGAQARTALIIVSVMTVHSLAEGIGVGVSFGGSETVGLATAAAIAVHNIPEGLAISLVLVPRGVSVGGAALWSVFSSLPQPLLALPAFLFVEVFAAALPMGLGFAGGAMIWMVAREIAPEVFHATHERIAFP